MNFIIGLQVELFIHVLRKVKIKDLVKNIPISLTRFLGKSQTFNVMNYAEYDILKPVNYSTYTFRTTINMLNV